MSSKKKESKKERKKRCERSRKKPYITSKKTEFKMPETVEEAVKMGILR